MKLSKQERIAVLVIAVIILLTLGTIFLIVPKFNEIGTDSASLLNKQAELKAAQDRAATKEQLGNDIIAAYNEGRNIADMFFEEMQPYEADNEIRAFLEYCTENEDEDKKVNVVVDSITIGSPTVAALGVTFYEWPEVEYDIKTYATQGQQATEEELAEQARTLLLQTALASSQTVGAIDVSFTVTALNDKDILQFVDNINDYIKRENGNDVRKAMRLTSDYDVTYLDIEKKYEEYANELYNDSVKEAKSQLAKDTNMKVEGADDSESASASTGGEGNEETTNFDEHTRQLQVTITMYSIERMQDPTDQLAAQNAQ